MGVEIDRGNRIIVNEYLNVPNHDDIFAIGDTAHFEQNGRPLATIAPVATQEADCVVANIMAQLNGREMRKFVYEDVGSMATIGRGDAVMAKGRLKMSGLLAWIAWMIVHLIRLAGTKTNFTVLLKWIWNYFGGTRLSRIITKEQ
jgi:NADH dehydrogenase